MICPNPDEASSPAATLPVRCRLQHSPAGWLELTVAPSPPVTPRAASRWVAGWSVRTAAARFPPATPRAKAFSHTIREDALVHQNAGVIEDSYFDSRTTIWFFSSQHSHRAKTTEDLQSAHRLHRPLPELERGPGRRQLYPTPPGTSARPASIPSSRPIWMGTTGRPGRSSATRSGKDRACRPRRWSGTGRPR